MYAVGCVKEASSQHGHLAGCSGGSVVKLLASLQPLAVRMPALPKHGLVQPLVQLGRSLWRIPLRHQSIRAMSISSSSSSGTAWARCRWRSMPPGELAGPAAGRRYGWSGTCQRRRRQAATSNQQPATRPRDSQGTRWPGMRSARAISQANCMNADWHRSVYPIVPCLFSFLPPSVSQHGMEEQSSPQQEPLSKAEDICCAIASGACHHI
jgi:hypothetical protein